MKRIIFIAVLLSTLVVDTYCQDMYSQAVGRKWLSGGEAVLRQPESFTFFLKEGVKYSIVIDSPQTITITCGGVTIEASSKEFTLTGRGEQVTLWITPSSRKAAITIGLYYLGRE